MQRELELVFNNELPITAAEPLKELGYTIEEVGGDKIKITKLSSLVHTHPLPAAYGEVTQIDIRGKDKGELLATIHKGSFELYKAS